MEPDQSASELIVEQIEIGPMRNFVYLVGSRSTREVAIVDPAWDVEGLIRHVNERGYKLTAALVTHYHPDHIGGSFGGQRIAGLAELLTLNPVRIYAQRAECDGIRKVTGVSAGDLVAVDSGTRLNVGPVEVEFLHTPGHTPGSQCFRVKETLVSGDTLFISGCGRVDLPGSDPEDMFHSLRKLAQLPDDTVLLPGHNYDPVPRARLGEMRAYNNYLKIKDLETWRRMMNR